MQSGYLELDEAHTILTSTCVLEDLPVAAQIWQCTGALYTSGTGRQVSQGHIKKSPAVHKLWCTSIVVVPVATLPTVVTYPRL